MFGWNNSECVCYLPFGNLVGQRYPKRKMTLPHIAPLKRVPKDRLQYKQNHHALHTTGIGEYLLHYYKKARTQVSDHFFLFILCNVINTYFHQLKYHT